ncbi:HD domain-containing protein [Desulfofarcimen acetoxidans DSM 771]|uniref:HD domain-containing protein n=1 Tax=Desulfofarcimen acetoxidans (strain ATCC 49208 / DSM 771 / KCTC 5769 / VKM B-1644 / 5575) TaxID=485916 RepID=C8VX01_DESAS|nr:HD domain-containing protein [Desulfofarcimen acetoxidans]ACV62577.1 HD domain-containing protein [Desulfofarcimen acetoxidans DSM 771]
MHQEQVKAFRLWFYQYTKSYYSDDPKIQTGIKFKEEHTDRVCQNINRIGQSLNLSLEDLYLADTVALFHDLGRFKQYTVYRSFNDRRTEDHAQMGLRELGLTGVLSVLSEEEKAIIKTAIEYHNQRDLPLSLPERCLMFARLIRDADKLDILHSFVEYYTHPTNDAYSVMETGLPDTPEYSQTFVQNLLQQQSCSYSDVANCNDRKLLQLSWIYDINFKFTLAEIARQGYITKIFDTLPQTTDLLAVQEHLLSFISN